MLPICRNSLIVCGLALCVVLGSGPALGQSANKLKVGMVITLEGLDADSNYYEQSFWVSGRAFLPFTEGKRFLIGEKVQADFDTFLVRWDKYGDAYRYSSGQEFPPLSMDPLAPPIRMARAWPQWFPLARPWWFLLGPFMTVCRLRNTTLTAHRPGSNGGSLACSSSSGSTGTSSPRSLRRSCGRWYLWRATRQTDAPGTWRRKEGSGNDGYRLHGASLVPTHAMSCCIRG